MLRKDRQRGVVDIKHTNGAIQSTDRWLVVKKRLDKASEVRCMNIFSHHTHIIS